MKSAIYCEHANESPVTCPCRCPNDCYCKRQGGMCVRKLEQLSPPSPVSDRVYGLLVKCPHNRGAKYQCVECLEAAFEDYATQRVASAIESKPANDERDFSARDLVENAFERGFARGRKLARTELLSEENVEKAIKTFLKRTNPATNFQDTEFLRDFVKHLEAKP